MAEAKPTASLSSGLLARKGAARPAMRRQGLGGHITSAHDDLGWNDMGHDPDHDESQAHAAHVAEIMPMLSPMGGKSAAIVPVQATEAEDLSDPQESPHAAETPVEVAHSPLSVKPGKPQVVLQREALEERVSKPAPSVAAITEDTSIEGPIQPVHEALKPDVPEVTEVAETVEPVSAERVPAPPSRPAPVAPQRAARGAPATSRTRRPVRPAGAKAAFTLRIDGDRHLRLRLASAVTNLSAQQILIDAFDAYLETVPEVEALAGNVARRNSDRS